MGRLSDADCRLLVIEEDGRPIGQVRLERTSATVATVSVSVAEQKRGRGLGREALRLACGDARRSLRVDELRALVRRENHTSLAAFAAVGFRRAGERDGVIELVAQAG
jgi:RimJ/RimL family protein N-acetyltransferase